MTFWVFDVMWSVMLFGVALFTGALVALHPAIRSIRTMGIVVSYLVGLAMLIVLPPVVAVSTWCLFATAGGVIAFLYELWARRRYRDTARPERPLVLLRGFILWPALIPEAVEGVLVDLRVLEPSGSSER